jgi:ATP-binding cassette, subfamily B, bacterial
MESNKPSEPSAVARVLHLSPFAGWWGWYCSALFAALSVAGLVLVGGTVAKLLEDGGLTGNRLPMGRHLQVLIPDVIVSLHPNQQLICVVGFGVVLALLQALSLWWFYRGIYRRTRMVSRLLHEQVLATTLQVAGSEGITAQRNRTGRLIDLELPKVQAGLIARWRAIPRSLILAVVCTTVALLVDFWLTLLAIISGLIVWRLYRWLESSAVNRIEAFDVPLLRKRLVEALQVAPLVSRVRGDDAPVLESGGPLMRLLEANEVHDSFRSRAVPLVTASATMVVCLLVLALGGNMLVDRSVMTLPAALVLALSLLGSVVGSIRVLRFWGRMGEFRESCETIIHFIDRSERIKPSEQMGLGGRKHAIELDGVTLLDGTGRTLLDALTLKLEPSNVIALLGTDPIAVNSLAELLLGFGTPKSGKVTIGGVSIHDLHQRWLSKNVMWIGRNGPVWAGTISENLGEFAATLDSGQISDATRKAGVYERIQELEDGFSTILDTDDERLDESAKYGLAIARTWIRRPAVVVVEEPPLTAGTLADDPGMDALCELASEGAMIIVLPQRLRTLRAVDRVILMNGGRLAGEGKHEELLATSDLYRHLNYVLFNPFRHMAPGGR